MLLHESVTESGIHINNTQVQVVENQVVEMQMLFPVILKRSVLFFGRKMMGIEKDL